MQTAKTNVMGERWDMQDKLVMGLLGSQGPEREREITASSLMRVLLLFENALDAISFSISNCTYTYRFLVLLSKEEVPINQAFLG